MAEVVISKVWDVGENRHVVAYDAAAPGRLVEVFVLTTGKNPAQVKADIAEKLFGTLGAPVVAAAVAVDVDAAVMFGKNKRITS